MFITIARKSNKSWLYNSRKVLCYFQWNFEMLKKPVHDHGVWVYKGLIKFSATYPEPKLLVAKRTEPSDYRVKLLTPRT